MGMAAILVMCDNDRLKELSYETAAYQFSRSLQFCKRRVLKGFNINGHDSHLGHVNSLVSINMSSCLMKAQYVNWFQFVQCIPSKRC